MPENHRAPSSILQQHHNLSPNSITTITPPKNQATSLHLGDALFYDDIIKTIVLWLPLNDILQQMLLCRRLYSLIDHPSQWEYYYTETLLYYSKNIPSSKKTTTSSDHWSSGSGPCWMNELRAENYWKWKCRYWLEHRWSHSVHVRYPALNQPVIDSTGKHLKFKHKRGRYQACYMRNAIPKQGTTRVDFYVHMPDQDKEDDWRSRIMGTQCSVVFLGIVNPQGFFSSYSPVQGEQTYKSVTGYSSLGEIIVAKRGGTNNYPPFGDGDIISLIVDASAAPTVNNADESNSSAFGTLTILRNGAQIMKPFQNIFPDRETDLYFFTGTFEHVARSENKQFDAYKVTILS